MYFIFRFRMMICLTIAPCLVVSAHLCMAQVGSGCNAPAAEPIVYVTLPGNPFTPVVTADGCKVFVALTGPDSAKGVAVLRRDGGALSLERTISLKSGGAGAVLTHDGRILAVAAGGSVAFLDAARLASGAADPILGYLEVGNDAGAIYVNVTTERSRKQTLPT
jgi:hypothetical protein